MSQLTRTRLPPGRFGKSGKSEAVRLSVKPRRNASYHRSLLFQLSLSDQSKFCHPDVKCQSLSLGSGAGAPQRWDALNAGGTQGVTSEGLLSPHGDLFAICVPAGRRGVFAHSAIAVFHRLDRARAAAIECGHVSGPGHLDLDENDDASTSQSDGHHRARRISDCSAAHTQPFEYGQRG